MKKTLAVAAVLAAFAGSAAADVTVYGKVDTGFSYVTSGDSHSFSMATGQSSGNRLGVKGSEKLANGMTVGFQLETGFNVDDGMNGGATKLGVDKDGYTTISNTMFHREARVYVATDFGTFHFGRMGTLDSGAGSVNLGGSMSAFGTGWSSIGDARKVITLDTRRDNVVTYQSPAMAGLTVYAQVASDNVDGVGGEYTHNDGRYWAVGAKYKAGAFEAMATASLLEDAQDVQPDLDFGYKADTKTADRYNYNVYAGYDFGVAKAMAQVGYKKQGQADQWGVVLSATAPVAGGKLLAEAGYGVATSATNVDTDNMNFGLGYQYNLSKQTYLYAGAGYTEAKVENGAKTDSTEVIFGLCHSF